MRDPQTQTSNTTAAGQKVANGITMVYLAYVRERTGQHHYNLAAAWRGKDEG